MNIYPKQYWINKAAVYMDMYKAGKNLGFSRETLLNLLRNAEYCLSKA